jgi:hypothetical protein
MMLKRLKKNNVKNKENLTVTKNTFILFPLNLFLQKPRRKRLVKVHLNWVNKQR